MASCITTKWGNDYSPQCQLTVTQKSTTDTTATLSWTLAYVTSGYAANTNGVGRSYSVKINGSTVKSGTYNINGLGGSNTRTIASGTTTVNKGTAAKSIAFSCSFNFDVTWGGTYSGTRTASGSISVAAKTSYTVGFNANGGTGAPSAQTKWHGTALTLSSTKPTRTGYTFKGWATTSGATTAKYSAGGSYTANASATLYAVWSINTWKVTYYANNGTGAPSAQTKKYGTTLTLSGVEPTRDGYEFVGWGTSASATTAAYQPGASYTSNAALNLYAVWKVAYWTPKITSLKALRCAENGDLDADGTYALVTFRWEVCTESGSFSLKSATVACNGKTKNATIEYDDGTTVKGSGSAIVGEGTLDVDLTYSATVKATDSSSNSPNYTEATKTVSTAKFLMDMLSGGGGLAFGRAARYEGYIESLFHLLMEPSKSIQGTYNGTNYNQLQPINANGNCVLGYGMYNAGVGATNLYGHELSLTTNSRYVSSNKPVRSHYRTCSCSSELTLGTSAKKIPLGTTQAYSTTLTEMSDGGIKCNLTGSVLVSATVYAGGLSADGIVIAQVYKNDTAYALNAANSGTKTFACCQLQTRAMLVEEGDIIYLYAYNYTEAKGSIAVANRTQLTVMYI